MKRTLTGEQIARVAAHALGPGTKVLSSRELVGGTFDSVHLLALSPPPGEQRTPVGGGGDPPAGGERAVLKVAPPAGTPSWLTRTN
ncbi:hypothetical protein ACIQV3_23280 [Streptomyces sp. NPDC099050]|uniref:hypothetical protein n=1 Tax=Streptomyces sp. NPDC099050 TaxID=3366100 RepID=UPI00381775BF